MDHSWYWEQTFESGGNAMGIPLGESGWWINVHLRMHGHILCNSHAELHGIEKSKMDDPETESGQIAIKLGLISKDVEEPCVIIVDRIRLATMTFIDVSGDVHAR